MHINPYLNPHIYTCGSILGMEFAILIHFPVISAYQFSAQNATFQLSQIFFHHFGHADSFRTLSSISCACLWHMSSSKLLMRELREDEEPRPPWLFCLQAPGARVGARACCITCQLGSLTKSRSKHIKMMGTSIMCCEILACPKTWNIDFPPQKKKKTSSNLWPV